MTQATAGLGSRTDGIGEMAQYDHQEPFAEEFMRAEGDAPYLRFAKAFSACWLQSKARIGSSELIVGIPRPGRMIHLDRAAGIMLIPWRYDELMESAIPDEEKLRLQEIHQYFKNRHVTSDLIQKEKEAAGLCIDSSIGRGPNYQGHILLDYAKILRIGVDGLRHEIRTRQSRGASQRPGFFDALLLMCDTITGEAEAYASEAERLADEAGSSTRADELRKIAAVCRRVAREPARTFHEAVQLHWFAFLIDSNDNPGRVDQLFGPYYAQDLRSGRIDPQSARLMLCDVWLKMSQVKAWGLVLGGVDSAGEDASNELTSMCLEITKELRLTNPNVSLRLSSKSPQHVWENGLDCISAGAGMPILLNDDAIIPAMRRLGVSDEDSRDYGTGGCIEYQIAGKCNFGGEDGQINVAKCLELALHNGVCSMTGERIGPETGDAAKFTSFDDVWRAYCRQVEWAAGIIADGCNIGQQVKSRQGAKLYRSLLISDCIEKGVDCDGGGARYGHGQILTLGIVVVADSLSVIKHLVFSRKQFTIAELIAALKADWRGYEHIRNAIRKDAPRFGNDDARADALAVQVADHLWSFLEGRQTSRGGHYTGLVVYFSRQYVFGQLTGATPDGRGAGDVLEDSIGPWPGRDCHGPTAVMQSAAKIPQNKAAGGVILNMKFPQSLFNSPDQREKVTSLFKTYFQLGGQHVQATVVNQSDLRQAMAEPEKWGHLIVRVGGFSERFVNLNRPLQESILARNSYG